MRTDIDSIVREVEANGVCIVPDFIPRDLLAHIKDNVDRLNVAERESGRGFIESEGANQRVFNLVNKGEVFEQIVQHDDVMDVMNKLLGGEEMVLHSDSGYVPPPHPEYLLSANAVWMIDDFTEENGGTRYVPGSHKLRDNPRPDGEYPTVPIIGKVGSVAFLHGYTWHKTGANVSRDQMRRALFGYYVRPFLRVQENHIVSVREEVWHRATARLRHLLGGDLWQNAIGLFDGPPAPMRKMAYPKRKAGVLS